MKKPQTNGREHIDPNIKLFLILFAGRLYITNVQEEDKQDEKAYVCMAINYFMRRNTYDKANYILPSGSKWMNLCRILKISSESQGINIHINTPDGY